MIKFNLLVRTRGLLEWVHRLLQAVDPAEESYAFQALHHYLTLSLAIS